MCFYVAKKDKDASAAVLKDLLIKKCFSVLFGMQINNVD